MAKEQDLSQIAKQFKPDTEGGFNTLDILMGLYHRNDNVIKVGVETATTYADIGDAELTRKEQSTALQVFQDDANKIISKKPNQAISDMLQSIRNELNSFGVKQEKLRQTTTDLKTKIGELTSAKTTGTISAAEFDAKRRELEAEIAKAKKEMSELQGKQKQLAAEITSKDSTLYRLIVSAAADLNFQPGIQPHLTQLKR